MRSHLGNYLDPVQVGNDEEGEVAVAFTPGSHTPVLAPASIRRLDGQALEVVGELQELVVSIQQAQLRLDALVEECRDLGVSWSAIGWSVGTSAQAARQRWGTPEGR